MKNNINAFIDKIENDVAELDLDNEQVVFIDLKYLPKNIKEGLYLSVKFTINQNKTKEIKKNVETLIQELTNTND